MSVRVNTRPENVAREGENACQQLAHNPIGSILYMPFHAKAVFDRIPDSMAGAILYMPFWCSATKSRYKSLG